MREAPVVRSHRSAAVLAAALLGALVVVPSPAGSAVVLVVDTTTDVVDPTPGDGACGSGAGTCSLRAAVQEANALAGADAITLPAGTYTLTLAGAGEDAAATGDLDVTGELTITGAGAASTIIDGNGGDRVLHGRGAPTASLSLQGVTITGGVVGPGGAFSAQGGGILAEGALTLVDAVVEGNAAADLSSTAFGGGIAARSTLTITGGAVRTNTVDGRAGAGRESGGGGIAAFGPTTITGTEISFNDVTATAQVGDTGSTSLNSRGGGVLLRAATSTISDAVIADNVAGHSTPYWATGGGVFIAPATSGSFVSAAISGTTVERNTAGTGGGIGAEIGSYSSFLDELASITITDSDLLDNEAGGSGGGMSVSQGTGVEVLRSTVAGNGAAIQGGGIYVESGSWDDFEGSAYANVTDSLVAGNDAGSSGGGAAQNGYYGTVGFVSSTISGNHAAEGAGGISGQTSIEFSTVVQNSTGTPGDPTTTTGIGGISALARAHNSILGPQANGADCLAWILEGDPAEPVWLFESGGYNTDSDGSCVGDALNGQPTQLQQWALPSDTPVVDPMLGALAGNGGPTWTHLPQAGSPAIDHGPVAVAECSGTDQRGVARPQGTACDTGAVEVEVGTAVVEGTVVEDGTGTPLAGISVRLLRTTGDCLIPPPEGLPSPICGLPLTLVDVATTAADGTYRFDDVVADGYGVRFLDMDGLHTPEYFSDAATADAGHTVAAYDFTTTTIDASLAPDAVGHFRGTVTEVGSGAPLPGVSVRLLSGDGMTLLGGRTASASGYYQIPLRPFGSYRMRFIDLDGSHVSEWHLNAASRLSSAVISHGTWWTTIDAELTPSG